MAGKYVHQKYETVESIYSFLKGDYSPKYPANVFLEVSNLCDLKCVMCGPFSALNAYRLVSIKEELRGFMPKPHNSALEDILAHALRIQVFGYGEPTLNPEFHDFLDLAGHFETLISFFTNGMHATPELVEKLIDNQVHEVSISFSGVEKSQYEAVYLGGVWETVLGGIRHLAKRKRERNSSFPVISINSLAYQHQIDSFDTFVELMADAGVNLIYLKPLIPMPAAPQLAHHAGTYRPWRDGKVLNRAKRLGAKQDVIINTHLFESAGASDEADYVQKRRMLFTGFGLDPDNPPPMTPIDQFAAIAKSIPLQRPNRTELSASNEVAGYEDPVPASEFGADGLYCFEPFNTLYVGRNSDVKPCCNAPHPTGLGNIKNMSASDLWKGTGFETIRETILEGKYPRMCHSCVKTGNAYASHALTTTISEYGSWYTKVFQSDFVCRPLSEIEACGQNAAVRTRWAAKNRRQI